MSVVAVVNGQIRGVRELRRKTDDRTPGEIFGREVSVLTEAGPVLGEIMKVTVFTSSGISAEDMLPGDPVTWAVSLESNKYGLQAKFQADLGVDERALVA